MSPSTVAVLVVAASVACSAGTLLPEAAQDQSGGLTLAPGESRSLPGSEAVLTFESVTEDSRCPTGVDCVWEGDAAVQIRVEEPGSAPAQYLLHTSTRFEREAVHGSLRIRLVSLVPHPAAESTLNPADYRATFSAEPK